MDMFSCAVTILSALLIIPSARLAFEETGGPWWAALPFVGCAAGILVPAAIYGG